jgi:alkylation response protein AidB-like acyl-CoA dehydrogenase
LAAKPLKKQASIAAFVAPEVATDNARDAAQMHGGYGLVDEYVIARHSRDRKILEVAVGTAEVQLISIAHERGL